MLDALGREVNYLRVSVTQRCNLNCLYCGTDSPDTHELTAAELEAVARAFAGLGFQKVRLTGGEPLIRQDIIEIAERIGAVPGIQKLAVTTNGVLLEQSAAALKGAGVDAVNVSLDTTDEENYTRLTGVNALQKVLRGLDAALTAGIRHVRVNAVLIRGVNDADAGKLIELAKDRKLDVRFIELMPFSDKGKNEDLVVKEKELLERFSYLAPLPPSERGGQPAKYYSAPGFQGRIGFISPVSDKFCANCNRVRLLSTGKIRPCLGDEATYDLRPYIGNEEKMREVIKTAVYAKPAGHHFECAYGQLHAMNRIGG